MPEGVPPEGGGAGFDPSDDELCELIAREGPTSEAGNEAYAELYRRYREAALRRASYLARPGASPEEIAAEAFAKTLQAMIGGLGPRESFSGYLFTAIRSEAQRQHKIDTITDRVDDEALEALAPVREAADEGYGESDQLRRAFADLAPEARRILWLVEVEGLSLNEVADRIGVKPPAAVSQLARAREALRTAYLRQFADAAPPACQEAAPHLAALVRGSLGKRLHRSTSAHVAGCERCRDQIGRLRSLNEQLRGWAGPIAVGGAAAAAWGVAGEAAPASALAAAPSSASAAAPATAPVTAGHQGVWAWVGGTAAVALIVVGIVLLALAPTPEARPAGPDPVSIDIGEPEAEAPAERVGEDREPQRLPAQEGEQASSYRSEEGRDLPWQDDRTPNWRLLEDRLAHLRER